MVRLYAQEKSGDELLLHLKSLLADNRREVAIFIPYLVDLLESRYSGDDLLAQLRYWADELQEVQLKMIIVQLLIGKTMILMAK